MENSKKNTNKNTVFCTVIAAISILAAFCIIPFHEAWRDEAQAWMIARDTTLPGLFDTLKYEGHPSLWYLILRPFAKLGLPYATLSYIGWFFASCGILLFALKAPFNKAFKTLVVLSPVFVYWLAVISRSYALIMLLVFLLADNYHQRKQRPIRYAILITLLVNTHILMAGFVGALLLIEMIDILLDLKNKQKITKARYAGFVLGVIGCLIMVIQMWGCMEVNGVVRLESGINYIYKTYQNTMIFATHLFSIIDVNFRMFMLLMFMVFMAATFLLLIRYFRQLLVFVCGLGFNLLIILVVFMPTGQKSHLLLIMLLFIAWTLRTDTDDRSSRQKEGEKQMRLSTIINVFTAFILAVSFIPGYLMLVVPDIKGNFSASKQVGHFLSENVGPDDIVIPVDDMLGASVVPYTKNVKFWNMYNDKFATYAILNVQRAYRMYDFETMMNELVKDQNGKDIPNLYKNSVVQYIYDYARSHFASGTKIYLVVCRLYYPRFDMEGIPSVFDAEQCSYYSFSEAYKVYELTVK